MGSSGATKRVEMTGFRALYNPPSPLDSETQESPGGEAGERGLVARGPVGKDLVEEPPPTPIDRRDDAVPRRGDRSGFDALIVVHRRTLDQAELLEPCECAISVHHERICVG
jgi:hypothetical protein